MSEWKEYSLGEICSFVKDKISMRDVGTDVYISTENMLPDKGGITRASSIPMDGMVTRYYPETVLISNIRPYFKKIWFADKEGGCSNDVLCFKGNDVLINSKYLYYLLAQDIFFDYVMLGSKGSKMPRGDKDHIMKWKVSIPPVDEQKRIAGVLSSLDDKIDLLHRENATLEALAETLFRHYFIENPNPEWKEGKVSDIAIHCKDSINPQKHSDEFFLHYSIPAYDNGKHPTAEQGQSIQSNKYVIPQKSILFSKLNPHKDKRVWLMLDDVQPNAICSTEFQIIKPQNDQWLYFLYEWLTYKENYDEIASGVSGTSGSHQRIDPKVIFENGCPIVDDFTLEQYNTKVKPIFEKIKSNQQRIQTLVIQRDMLLPRLMSGKVKIIEQ